MDLDTMDSNLQSKTVQVNIFPSAIHPDLKIINRSVRTVIMVDSTVPLDTNNGFN